MYGDMCVCAVFGSRKNSNGRDNRYLLGVAPAVPGSRLEVSSPVKTLKLCGRFDTPEYLFDTSKYIKHSSSSNQYQVVFDTPEYFVPGTWHLGNNWCLFSMLCMRCLGKDMTCFFLDRNILETWTEIISSSSRRIS